MLQMCCDISLKRFETNHIMYIKRNQMLLMNNTLSELVVTGCTICFNISDRQTTIEIFYILLNVLNIMFQETYTNNQCGGLGRRWRYFHQNLGKSTLMYNTILIVEWQCAISTILLLLQLTSIHVYSYIFICYHFILYFMILLLPNKRLQASFNVKPTAC